MGEVLIEAEGDAFAGAEAVADWCQQAIVDAFPLVREAAHAVEDPLDLHRVVHPLHRLGDRVDQLFHRGDRRDRLQRREVRDVSEAEIQRRGGAVEGGRSPARAESGGAKQRAGGDDRSAQIGESSPAFPTARPGASLRRGQQPDLLDARSSPVSRASPRDSAVAVCADASAFSRTWPRASRLRAVEVPEDDEQPLLQRRGVVIQHRGADRKKA